MMRNNLLENRNEWRKQNQERMKRKENSIDWLIRYLSIECKWTMKGGRKKKILTYNSVKTSIEIQTTKWFLWLDTHNNNKSVC
jgi:hypothetical protein